MLFLFSRAIITLDLNTGCEIKITQIQNLEVGPPISSNTFFDFDSFDSYIIMLAKKTIPEVEREFIV